MNPLQSIHVINPIRCNLKDPEFRYERRSGSRFACCQFHTRSTHSIISNLNQSGFIDSQVCDFELPIVLSTPQIINYSFMSTAKLTSKPSSNILQLSSLYLQISDNLLSSFIERERAPSFYFQINCDSKSRRRTSRSSN